MGPLVQGVPRLYIPIAFSNRGGCPSTSLCVPNTFFKHTVIFSFQVKAQAPHLFQHRRRRRASAQVRPAAACQAHQAEAQGAGGERGAACGAKPRAGPRRRRLRQQDEVALHGAGAEVSLKLGKMRDACRTDHTLERLCVWHRCLMHEKSRCASQCIDGFAHSTHLCSLQNWPTAQSQNKGLIQALAADANLSAEAQRSAGLFD